MPIKLLRRKINEQRFFIDHDEYKTNLLVIFANSTDDITQPWDGTYQGQDCIEASYVYLIKYSFQYNPSRKLEKVGSILLLR